MFENSLRRMPRPQDIARMTTQELRDTFLLTNLFSPGQLTGTFTVLDRLVAGGVHHGGSHGQDGLLLHLGRIPGEQRRPHRCNMRIFRVLR